MRLSLFIRLYTHIFYSLQWAQKPAPRSPRSCWCRSDRTRRTTPCTALATENCTQSCTLTAVKHTQHTCSIIKEASCALYRPMRYMLSKTIVWRCDTNTYTVWMQSFVVTLPLSRTVANVISLIYERVKESHNCEFTPFGAPITRSYYSSW